MTGQEFASILSALSVMLAGFAFAYSAIAPRLDAVRGDVADPIRLNEREQAQLKDKTRAVKKTLTWLLVLPVVVLAIFGNVVFDILKTLNIHHHYSPLRAAVVALCLLWVPVEMAMLRIFCDLRDRITALGG
jgi:hypothetical protein